MRTRIKHVGKHPGRLTPIKGYFNRERVFARRWVKENHPPCWLNGGIGILQGILDPDCGSSSPVPEITQAEAAAAATVIQWLGSNCGWSFLEECIRKCGYRIVPKKEK